MTLPYVTGQVQLTNGSKAIVGNGTAWQTANIAGGVIYVEGQGNPLPIASIDGDTQATAAVKWMGASGTYNYALTLESVILPQTAQNANKLAQLIQQLGSKSVSALSALGDTMAAGKVPRANANNSMAWIDVSDFILNLLNDPDGPTAYATLGTVPDARLPSVQSAKSFTGSSLFSSNGTTLSFQRNNANAIDIEAYQTGLSATKHAIELNRYGGGVTAGGYPVWHNGIAPTLFDFNGYQKLPSGLIMQWGLITNNNSPDYFVTFPISFPVSPLNVLATPSLIGLAPGTMNTISVANASKTGFEARVRYASNGGAVGQTAGVSIFFLALGF